nr:Zinc finger, RING-type [Ipomoea trifida]
MLQKAREIDAFDQQNHSAVPQYNDKSYSVDKNGIHGANSVKATSYEEEALRTMKAFWLPSATPEAPRIPVSRRKLALSTSPTSVQSVRPCKDRNVVNLEKGGTGFAAHGDNLEA